MLKCETPQVRMRHHAELLADTSDDGGPSEVASAEVSGGDRPADSGDASEAAMVLAGFEEMVFLTMSPSSPENTREHPTHCMGANEFAGFRKTENNVEKILRVVVTVVNTRGLNCVRV